MARFLAGRGSRSSARLRLPFAGLAAFGDAHGVWGDASGTVARLLNMSCYDVATLGRGSRLIRPEANHLAYTRPIRFVHPFPTAKDRVNRS